MILKERLYYKMKLIREAELAIEKLFSEGKLRGTTHGSKGQEAVPVALAEFLDPSNDYVCGGHRSHGHLLSLSNDVKPLIAELMTKETGYVKGKGGSQHVKYERFICNGITGGMVPVAVGLAFAQKFNNPNSISVVFFGDGAMNEGYVLEAMNLAAVYELPVLFVLENNSFAMSTSISEMTKNTIKERVRGFGIEYHFQKAIDVMSVYELSEVLVKKVRSTGKPIFVEFQTYRFSGHSKSDKREYIQPDIEKYWIENDPLERIKNELPFKDVSKINEKVHEEIDRSIKESINDPFPIPE